MAKVTLSIIIPTLNEEKYLPYLLSDLAKQQKKNFEVIIVDGSSVDRTKEFAIRFDSFFPLRIITVTKRNVSFQRNTGALHARGESLLFLDADSRVLSSFTRNITMHFKRRGNRLYLPILSGEKNSKKLKLLFGLINKVIETSQQLGKPLSAGGSLFVNKGIFNRLHGFNKELFLSEDHDFVQRASQKKIKITVLKDVKVVFSLRRVKKEGQILFLYKILFSFLHVLISGGMKEQIFPYEMGGLGYEKMQEIHSDGNSVTLEKNIQKFLRRVSSFLN